MVHQVKDLAELQTEFKSAGDRAVLVDFYATWCGPCKQIAPKIEDLSRKHANLVVLKVDIDEAEDAALFYAIEAMPTFMLFRNGNKIGTVIGASLAKIEALLTEHKIIEF